MAKSWADLSKDERAATGMTKLEYNQSTGYRAEQIANEQSNPTPSPAPSPEPSPTPSPSPAAEAVERSQSWANLSKDEREETGQTKQEFNQSTGFRAEEIALNNNNNNNNNVSSASNNNRGNATPVNRGASFDTAETIAPGASSPSAIVADQNNEDPLNTKYSEMSDAYKATTTKAQHKEARKVAGTYTNNRLESYNVDSLDDFDRTATGRGRDTGEDRLSVTELENMRDIGGFSEQEIYDYAMTGSAADSKRGTKAQALLDSFKSELITDPIDGGDPPPVDGGDPPPVDGGDPPPVDGGDPPPVDGGDPPPVDGGDPPPVDGGDGPPNSGDFLNEHIEAIINNGGNANIQDVNINQSNEQNQSIVQDNDITSEVIGDYNDTTINQDNTAINSGGNQANDAEVSNTNEAGAQDLLNEYVTDITDDAGQSESGGNLNAQIVDVEQDNTQNQTIEQDNDIDSRIEGDFNTTEINQNNSASNIGGEQTNSSTVTNSAEGQAQDLLGGYIEGINTAQSDSSSNPSEEVDSAIVPEDSGPDYSTLAGQDLTNPATFLNFQEVQSQSDNTQSQSADQNNDINSQITGNNNFTQISQDNSVRNYGGDQRNFTYVSNNNNPYTDTPASAATMAGFYEVSDSPGSNAAFVDQYSTLNRDNQKYYDNVGQANEMIYRANSVSPIDTNALEDSLYQSSELARARGQIGLVNVFGDMQNFPQFSWNSATRQSGISSPDFGELAEEISDGF